MKLRILVGAILGLIGVFALVWFGLQKYCQSTVTGFNWNCSTYIGFTTTDELVEATPQGFSKVLEKVVTRTTPTPSLTLKPLPSAKNLSEGTQVFQTFNNCGPASLSMALSHYNVDQTQQVLGQALRPWQNSKGDNDDKSVTLSELALKAEELGFETIHRPAGSIEIIKQLINYDLPIITRTLLTADDDIGHYRVITGYDETNQTLIQDDSLQGKQLSYSYRDYLELWEPFNFEFLVLVPSEKVLVVETILGGLSEEESAWKEALALSNQKLDQNPNDLYARFNRAVSLYHLDAYQASVNEFENVQSRLPFRTLWYQIEPILAYYKLGDHDQVLKITQQILENQNRAYSELYQLRGQIFESRGQTELSQEAYALAQQYGSENEYWKVNLE